MSKESEKSCFKKLSDGYLKRDSNIRCLFDNSDSETIKDIIISSRPNTNDTAFPDFLFRGGAIEHYEVTTAKEIKGKGSAHKSAIGLFERDTDKQILKSNELFKASHFVPNTTKTDRYEMTFDDFKYEYFIESIKRNIESHVSSLKKSNKYFDKMVFLLEHKGGMLFCEDGNGKLLPYKISNDIAALNILKNYIKVVDYIIYVSDDNFEILDLSKIDDMLQNANNDLPIKCGRSKNIILNVQSDLKLD